jgi:hypothetical protein
MERGDIRVWPTLAFIAASRIAWLGATFDGWLGRVGQTGVTEKADSHQLGLGPIARLPAVQFLRPRADSVTASYGRIELATLI